MGSVRRGAMAVGLALMLAGAPGIAGATLPPAASTAPSDDLTVPVLAPGTSVAEGVSWLEAATTARATELTSLVASIGTAVSLQPQVRSSTLGLVTSAEATVAQIASAAPTLSTLTATHKAIAQTIGLHVFSVTQPQVTEILTAQSIRSSVLALLAQEPSIRAAIAASTSTNLRKATALIASFHAHLVQAKALVVPIPAALLLVGSYGIVRATTKLTTAATSEATATSLVSQAKHDEQSIVTSLGSKDRAKLQAH